MTPYYEHGGITIYHGDCRDILPCVHAEVMLMDPPYGISFTSGWENKFRDVVIANDEDVSARDLALDIWGDKPALVFGSWKQSRPRHTRAVLIWDKGTVGMGDLSIPWFPCTEEIYVLGCGWIGSRTSSVMRHVVRNYYHPTEKPEQLIKALLVRCPGGTVLDPFMGSGTTLVASKEMGRTAIGIEIEERYCEIAAERLAQDVLPWEHVVNA